MRVNLRQTGGFAALSSQIQIDGRHIAVRRGQRTHERELTPEEDQEVRLSVRKLSDAKVRPSYGALPVNDGATSVLAIHEGAGRKVIEVQQDPRDPPPAEFTALLNVLRQLASAL